VYTLPVEEVVHKIGGHIHEFHRKKPFSKDSIRKPGLPFAKRSADDQRIVPVARASFSQNSRREVTAPRISRKGLKREGRRGQDVSTVAPSQRSISEI